MADKLCSIAGCGPVSGKLRAGMCGAHYARKRAGKPMDTPIAKWGVKTAPVCLAADCEQPQSGAGLCDDHHAPYEAADGTDVPCAYIDCGRLVKLRGLCQTHYNQRRTGKPLVPVRWVWRGRAGALCSFEGCGKDVQSLGWCGGHYGQQKSGKDLKPLRVLGNVGVNDGPCSFEGCVSDAAVRGLCNSHYEMQRTGKELRPLMWRHGEGLSQRGYHLRYGYNITEAQYDVMLDAQGGVCAACGGVNSSGHALAVDHDHACCPESGRSCGECVRGLLCATCNIGIGYLQDSASALRAAADYLDLHAAKSRLRAA